MKTKRRGRGEGSVFQRKDGSWCAILSVGYDANGKRRRRWIYGADKSKVLEKFRELQAKTLLGDIAEPQHIRVGHYLDRWLADTVRSRVRPSTYRLYTGIVRIHVSKHLGGIALTRLTPYHIRAMLAEMETANTSPRLRQIAFVVLRKALKQAVRDGSLSRNPCDAVDAPKTPRHMMKSLTHEEVARLLGVVKGDRLEALYVLALTIGMREAELFGLTWTNVSLKDATLQVTHQLAENNGHPTLVEPKTKSAVRQIDLPAFALNALREHRQRALGEATLYNPLGLVFTDKLGKPLRRSNFLRRDFASLLRMAGLECRFHDLRHTAASLALRESVPPHVVTRMLGHSRVSITMDSYAHVLPGQGKEAAAKMDALFAGLGR